MSTLKVVECPACGQHNRVPAAASGSPRCRRCHQPLPWLVEADDDDFAEVVERSRLPVLVDLWAAWCAPCRTVAPGVERAARDLAGRHARSIPTLLVVRGGEVVARQVGALPADRLMAWARSAAGADSSPKS